MNIFKFPIVAIIVLKTYKIMAKKAIKTCPSCNSNLKLILKEGIGCSDCYTCFDTELKQLLIKLHGSATHKGKSPKTQKTDLKSLKEKLAAAIEIEDYETATKVKKQIEDIK